MKRWIPWVAAAIVIVVLGSGVLRAVAARKAQQQALAESAGQRAEAVLTLQPSELLAVRRQVLTLGLPVSGTLRALHSASVKARVAGELQDLTVREGDSVRAGQVVARIDATETAARLRQAQQQADAAKAQVDISQRQFNNNRALVDQGFISTTALETSQASLQSAQASYQAATAAADVARKALEDTVLRSPISGQVAQRLAQNGERVGVDLRVLDIVDLSRLELEALVAPADAAQVRVGQQARLQLEGSPLPVTATVVRINPSAQSGSRAVPVYLEIDTASAGPARPLLRQGLFVQGTLETGRAEPLALPLDAVRTDKPQPYVQVVDNDRIVHRSVQTGARAQVDGATLVAVDGLPEGTLVVAGALGPLREGTAVRRAPVPAAGNATAR